ncbi:MAG: type III-A CRISPR-associated RAMP protein Csm3, partial [Candidatus Eremiobacterota bacterium]
MSYKFIGNVILSGTIECNTGLHIGGTEEAYQIGGMDNPVIKDPLTGYPYIPGSSLKGKLRTIMEWEKNKINTSDKNFGGIHECQEPNCPVCRIFGTGADNSAKRQTGPTRIFIRDSFPTEKTQEEFQKLIEQKGVPVEVKTEVVINRITSAAMPRSMERVPRGAKFNFEIIYSIYDINDKGIVDVENLKNLITVMKLMEESALGGGGSRGAGRIKFKLHKEIEIKQVA